MSPTIGSMFSGYGGLDAAVAAHFGAQVAWVMENDKHMSLLHAHHHGEVPNYGDVTGVDWGEVPPVDIITAGFPCQDISHAGKRVGIHGERSGLWASTVRAIEVLRPKVVVVENVSALRSAKALVSVEPCEVCVGDTGPAVNMRALGRVLADLAEVGFDAGWGSVRASDAGAPHRRERVFVFATDPSGGQLPRVAEQEHELSEPSERSGRPVTLLPTPAVNDMGAGKTVQQWDEWTARMREKHGNGNGHGKSLAIEAQRMLPTPTGRDWKGRNQRDDATCLPGAVRDFGPYLEAVQRWEQVLGRPAPPPTEPDGRNGNPRLSPRFVEWMMGLPGGWVTDVPGVGRTAALKALGNGVVPQQALLALRLLDPRLSEAA